MVARCDGRAAVGPPGGRPGIAFFRGGMLWHVDPGRIGVGQLTPDVRLRGPVAWTGPNGLVAIRIERPGGCERVERV